MSQTPERWVAIQRNPKSGSGAGARELLRLVAALKRRGIRPRLYSHRADLDAAVNSGTCGAPTAIVAAGGDGTLLDVANRFPGKRFAVLPLGTENLFAKSIGMPCDGEKLAEIIAIGTTRRFDVARCNGRRFLVVASLGFDAEVIRDAHARRSGRIRRWFYIVPIVIALIRYRFPMAEVRCDDDSVQSAALVVIGNLPRYALGLKFFHEARGDDGWLDVCLFKRPGRFRVIADFLAVWFGRHWSQPHVEVRRARRVVVNSSQSMPVQLDGDAGGFAPAEFDLEPGAMEVFTP